MSGPISFGEPFVCNKDDAKCYACKEKIPQGEKLLWDFNNKHRYHEKCGRERVANDLARAQIVRIDEDQFKAFIDLCKVKEPAKTGLFTGGTAPNFGMTSEQTKAFNDMARRVDQLEKQIKEMRGDG